MLNWDDFRYLLAVDVGGSASAAARMLKVDKATVTRRVSALERAVGVRLLHRRAGGWKPTDVGQRLISTARQVDLRFASLLSDLGGMDGAPRATVRVTAPQWFCCEILLPALPAFIDATPWLDLELLAGSRMVNLAQREAEVALRNVRPSKGDFVSRRAGELGSALYASRRYLSGRPVPRDRQSLSGHRVVGYSNVLTYVPGFAWLNDMTDQLSAVLRVDDAQALRAAVRAGVGVGVLPCLLGDGGGDLVRVGDERHRETIWVVAPIEMARTRAAQAALGFVTEAFRKSGSALAGR